MFRNIHLKHTLSVSRDDVSSNPPPRKKHKTPQHTKILKHPSCCESLCYCKKSNCKKKSKMRNAHGMHRKTESMVFFTCIHRLLGGGRLSRLLPAQTGYIRHVGARAKCELNVVLTRYNRFGLKRRCTTKTSPVKKRKRAASAELTCVLRPNIDSRSRPRDTLENTKRKALQYADETSITSVDHPNREPSCARTDTKQGRGVH